VPSRVYRKVEEMMAMEAGGARVLIFLIAGRVLVGTCGHVSDGVGVG